MTSHANDYWDDQAGNFDSEPDHGLGDVAVRAAWRELLVPLLPPPPASVADLGCGTGSLTLLLADQGYDVCGFDLSARMLDAARNKLSDANLGARFIRSDVSRPPRRRRSADVVLERHVLWAVDDPGDAVARWCELLRPGGTLLLIEGRWSTGGGITAPDAESLVRRCGRISEVIELPDARLWGRRINDVRYALVSRG